MSIAKAATKTDYFVSVALTPKASIEAMETLLSSLVGRGPNDTGSMLDGSERYLAWRVADDTEAENLSYFMNRILGSLDIDIRVAIETAD